MFHPGLFKLMHLQWKGGIRQFRNSLRTVRGALQLLFFSAMAVSFVFTMIVARFGSDLPTTNLSSQWMAPGLLLMTCSITLFSSGAGGIVFTPAEVAFLFPAPMTRRQLLGYKQLNNAVGIAIVSVVFAITGAPTLATVPASFVGVFLTMWFMSLLVLNVALVRHVLDQKTDLPIRGVIGFVVCAMIVWGVGIASTSATTMNDALVQFRKSLPGAILLTPFQFSVNAIQVPGLTSFVTSVAVLLVIDLALLFLSLRLDVWSLEAALGTSEKIADRLKQLRTRGIWQAFGKTSAAAVRRRLPMPPFWAGLGPIAWQRSLTALRSSTGLVSTVAGAMILAASVVYFTKGIKHAQMAAPLIGIISMIYVSFLACLLIQNDINRVIFLKSLPLRSVSVALGDLIVAPTLISLIQSVFILLQAWFFPQYGAMLICSALLILPANVILFGTDKLVFYVYPTRMINVTPGDFQAVGRQMFFMAIKMLVLFVFAAVPCITSVLAALLMESTIATFATAGGTLAVECAVLIPLLAIAFDRFDPGVTQVN